MVAAWQVAFADLTSVECQVGNIFDFTADAIVSPANSFGYMDGGIDLAYRGFFGPEIEARLQRHIQTQHHGELPVGQAVVIETRHHTIPFLVSAPTMRVPAVIEDTVNVYLGFRAALLAVRRHNESAARPIKSLLSPAFGTGVGGMDFLRVPRCRARSTKLVG
jgi:O-acetyl-ADP-ribose deacetylase (regulator of RNase III)